MNIKGILSQRFTLLDQPKHRWLLILFCTSFGILFINLFVPFNINRWNKDSGLDQFIRLSGFGLIAGIVLFVSQFGIRKLVPIKQITIGIFILWLIGEILIMTGIFTCYQSGLDISLHRFLRDTPNSLKYTSLGILIPYSLSILIIFQIIQKTELGKLKTVVENSVFKPELIAFPDEKGIVRFSVLGEQILYLESADNYVIVYFSGKNKIEKQIIRNSLKNIEGMFENSPIIRCHRSFMVNLQKIELVDYEKSSCRIKLNGIENYLPVSRKFYPDFKQYIRK